jgi:hypothetical protein
MMQENYCFRCGCYTRIDEHSKLCDTCYEDWRADQSGVPSRQLAADLLLTSLWITCGRVVGRKPG